MERHDADPARSYRRTYWTASLYHGAGLKPKHVAFAHSDERAPRISFDEDWPDVVSVWIGGTSFEAPIAQRARIEEWLATNSTAAAPVSEPGTHDDAGGGT
jgi:hypothetical protein